LVPKRFQRWTRVLTLMVVAECILLSVSSAQASSAADFSSATNAIGKAFVATYEAGQSGGNVSQLLSKLNLSLSLLQEANVENATNPTQAAADLQNATLTANSVTAASVSVAQMGRASRQTTVLISAISAYAIVVAAALIYIFGDRLYRRLWLFLYRDFLVRLANA
jgi:hypothetical protein